MELRIFAHFILLFDNLDKDYYSDELLKIIELATNKLNNFCINILKKPFDKLIIENIQLLEQANKLLNEEIHVKLFETVDKVIKEHVDSFGEWEGYYKFSEDYLAFAPSCWKAKDSNKYHQNFYATQIMNNPLLEFDCKHPRKLKEKCL